MNDVWQMPIEDRTWSRIIPAGPLPEGRYRHAAVYDPIRDRMLILGGDTFTGPSNETWELSLSHPPTWRKLSFRHHLPPTLTQTTAVAIPGRDWIVMQGGYRGSSPDNGVWVLEGRQPAAPACECPDTLSVKPGGDRCSLHRHPADRGGNDGSPGI